ncbi:MAG: hypothetical protein AAF847_00145 [Bacteroidota bacterium]
MDVSIISLALHYAQLGIERLELHKHFGNHQQMKDFLTEISDQISTQLDSEYVYIVRKRIGKKMITAFDQEEQANAYIEKEEDLEVFQLKKAA